MVNFKITKKQKILEVNNDMAHNYYFLVYGHIYNEDKTRYRKFKFVIWFDIFDLQEYFDKEYITDDDVKEYVSFCVEGIENSYITEIKDYYDTEGLKNFYDYCRETIENYNKICCA